MHIFRLPKGVIHKINSIITTFIWVVMQQNHKFHLVNLDISKCLVNKGGSGLLDIYSFNLALLFKNLWRVVSRTSLWNQIIKPKYLHNKDFIDWIRAGAPNPHYCSFSWCNFLHIKPWLFGNMKWHTGSISTVKIGLNHLSGLTSPHLLFVSHIIFLNNHGFSMIQDTPNKNLSSSTSTNWKDTKGHIFPFVY